MVTAITPFLSLQAWSFQLRKGYRQKNKSSSAKVCSRNVKEFCCYFCGLCLTQSLRICSDASFIAYSSSRFIFLLSSSAFSLMSSPVFSKKTLFIALATSSPVIFPFSSLITSKPTPASTVSLEFTG